MAADKKKELVALAEIKALAASAAEILKSSGPNDIQARILMIDAVALFVSQWRSEVNDYHAAYAAADEFVWRTGSEWSVDELAEFALLGRNSR